ncbi:sporulation protein YjcZ [Alkalihalophilus pseudofirmus]|nr:sporulation protein YjcZ [Alkalihalophilus pseudofirmus]
MGYYGGYGCGYGYGPVAGAYSPGCGFALIVVLFILLIIVGTAFCK